MHFGDQRRQLQFGHTGANATVDAIAEGQMAAGVLAVDDDLVAIGEDAFVAVGRAIPERQLVALLDLVAEQFGVFGRGAAHMGQRRLPADQLMHRVDGEVMVVVLLQLGALLGELVEPVSKGRHRIARRVIAADDQQDKVPHEFLMAHMLHRIGLEHDRDEVMLAGVLGLFVPKLLERGAHFKGGGEPVLALFQRPEAFDIAKHVRPTGQLVAFFKREIEQDGEHLRCQLDRQLFHPIKRRVERQAVEDGGGPLNGISAHAFHFGGAKGRRDSAALRCMLRRVHGDEHRHRHIAFLQMVDPVTGNRDAAIFPTGGKDFGQRLNMHDRLVGRDRPIGAELGLRAVVDGRGFAHLPHRFLPHIIGKKLRAGDIPRVCFDCFVLQHGRHASPLLFVFRSSFSLPLFTSVSMGFGARLRQMTGACDEMSSGAGVSACGVGRTAAPDLISAPRAGTVRP